MPFGQSFAQSRAARLISSPIGRATRILIGLSIALLGYAHPDKGTGVGLMIIGAVPFVAGVLNLCFLSALLGGPISGERITMLHQGKGA